MAVVATLRVAPVKSLATITPGSIQVDEHGVPYDRRLFLLDDSGSVVTLRSHPALVQIIPDLDVERGVISVTLPDGSTAASRLDSAADEVSTVLFGKQRVGRLVVGDAAEAISTFAGERLRLVLADRVGVGWDQGPVSILGRASAVDIGGRDRDVARFRMLVEVTGTEPYEEDTWVGQQVELGDARVRITHPLVRCVIITRSPTTGEKDWEGLQVLAAKRGPDRLCLGVIAAVTRPGRVAVGSPVRVLNGA